MFASDSREIERSRQIDIYSKVPHVQRMRLSFSAYDLFGQLVPANIPTTEHLAYFCCCPDASTVDDTP
jgi:hypothetical protein